MSVVTTPETPAITIDPSTNTPATPPAPPAPAPKANDKPEWLDERLEQARRSALKDAGFASPELAKKALDALKAIEAQEAAKRTIEEQKVALEQSLKTKDEQLSGALETLRGYAASQMAALSEAQKAAVVAVAGDDAAKQLKTIEALRPTWASAAAPAAPAAQPPAPKIVDTSTGKSMPSEGVAGSAPDPKAVWAEMRKTNPVAAARYAQEHGLLNY